jgi:hypothetical protein
MGTVYDALKVLHLLSFVFMSIPLFNLIVVNERALMGSGFVYATDRYMENIIRHGAPRCFIFQTSVLATGVLLLLTGPLGMAALWQNWVLLTKAILLLLLMGMLSYVHLGLQPKIEAQLTAVGPDTPVPPGLAAALKPYRLRRKRLATFCLFLVITTIVLGVQVYSRFTAPLTFVLIGAAAVFSWRANKTLIHFGWV